MVKVSIIILAKNEERYIGHTLAMVFRQKHKEHEVILLDSGSRDSTLEIAKRYPVKTIEIPAREFGHGRTRNYGVQIAKGEIVVFLNADATPMNETWLKNLIANFEGDEKIAGVYSYIYPRHNCNPLRFWEILNENANKRVVKQIENIDARYQYMEPREKRRILAFQTISCAIRKEFLLNYPFKNMDFGEDLEWSKRIMENGFKVVFEPTSMVLHSHNFYCSFIKTFKKYFDDARLNKQLLNMWAWRNFPILFGYIAYKIFRDIRHILRLNKGIRYKIRWFFYSPIIRLAEFFGIIAGANSRHLPYRLNSLFSLVNEIKQA